jgi:hypothetical protein
MIYKIRIILDSEEDIFRDVEIDGDSTLEDFHNVITQSFGFLGNEMASFYTCDDRWNQIDEISLFDVSEQSPDVRLMHRTTIKEVMSQNSPKLIYIYDFLSMWTFFVELASMEEEEPGRSYPNLLFSFGEIPETPPEKNFESDPAFDFDDTFENYDDLDFDENWN